MGSTHREAPHAFGVTWTSGKGPTLDGRMKPDVVAPGEWIASAATGQVRAAAGLDPPPGAAPGEPADLRRAVRARRWPRRTSPASSPRSCPPGRSSSAGPQQVKALLTQSATDLGRERYAQGAGLVDLMRMLANV